MTNISEIKVKYDGNKCHKCGRDMKKGWTGYFENNNGIKKLYCKPCGDVMLSEPAKQQELEQPKAETFEAIAQLALIVELLPQIDERLKDMQSVLTDFIQEYIKTYKAVMKPDKSVKK